MSDLTAKFATLEAQLATQAATSDALVDTVEAKLQAIFDELDIMLVNNAANTRYLLAAIGQSGTCFPCPTPTIVIPPIGTTPTPANNERCQRAQGIIATIHAMLAAMDTLQSYNVVGTFNVINDAISEVIGAIAAGDTLPLPSFPETVNIVGNFVSYAGERLFSGVGLIDQFTPLELSLLTAIAPSSDASASRAQYESVIDASSVSLVGKLMFKAIAYTALWTYYFNPTSSPDLSGFDGSVCGFAVCQDIASSAVTTSGFAGNGIIWPSPFGATNSNGAGAWSANVFCTDDLSGWTITADQNVRIYEQPGSTHDDLNVGFSHVCGATTFLIVFDAGNGTPFTMTLCPPGS